ncbi:MAG: hypothetical protein ACC613_00360 [Synergistales bacterium]
MAPGSRRSGLGRKFLWLALFIGILCGAENHYQLLRLVELTVVPSGSLPDPVLWRSIGSLSRRFWIIPLLRRDAIVRELEERYPAEITVSITGWGRIGISVRPHVPWLVLVYQGQDFILSEDGTIWPRSLSMAENAQKGRKPVMLPCWEWDKNLLNPFGDPSRRQSIVQLSTLPVQDLREWNDELSKQGWFGRPLRTTVSMRGGVRYLKVVAQRNSQRIQLELGDKTKEWETIFPAIRKILAEPGRAGEGTLIVDATYEGKIVARHVPPDGTDGKRLRPEGSESN